MDFKTRVVKSGKIAVFLCIIANFLPGIYLWLVHGIVPTFKDLIQLWLLAAGAFGVSWIVPLVPPVAICHGLLVVLLIFVYLPS